MQINSIDDALALPPGRFYLQHPFSDLDGNVTTKHLSSALKRLGNSLPLEATCQAEIIVKACELDNPTGSYRWEL
jgi:hypothetical protein